jgi:glycosyltransferase involved in cell wall biosynthesis
VSKYPDVAEAKVNPLVHYLKFGLSEGQIIRQENRYLGAARNASIGHTDTPYIIFLDDDNIPFPNMIASTIRENISPQLAPILDLLMGTYAL